MTVEWTHLQRKQKIYLYLATCLLIFNLYLHRTTRTASLWHRLSIRSCLPRTFFRAGSSVCVCLSPFPTFCVVARQLIKMCGRCFIIFRVDTLIQFKFDASRGRHIIDLNYICMPLRRACSVSLSPPLSRAFSIAHYTCVWRTFPAVHCLASTAVYGFACALIAFNCNRLSDTYSHAHTHTHPRKHTHTHILIMSKNGKKINNNLLRLRAVAAKASLINLWDCNFCHRHHHFRFFPGCFDSNVFQLPYLSHSYAHYQHCLIYSRLIGVVSLQCVIRWIDFHLPNTNTHMVVVCGQVLFM